MDLFVSGDVFLDIVFTGLPRLPRPGEETWAPGMGSSPGGIANLAVAAARLGLNTGLGAAFSTDAYGEFCREVLREQGIDLGPSRCFADWHSPVTVSLAYERDRSMITHGHPAPVGADGLVGELPAATAAAVSLTGGRQAWVRRAARAGTLVFANVGWDDTAAWPAAALDLLEDCHAFLPNAVEAMRYTRTATPREALHRLAERVPLAVVTCGADGALAIDAATGQVASAPAVPVEALDPTGAGDVFNAGFIAATLWGLPLRQRLVFANLVAALSVRHFGGSLSAPGWADIAAWWGAQRPGPLGGEYGFLEDLIPAGDLRLARRAGATIDRLPDAA
ncbi:carbohydrate kinase family protein [Dactylosporangium sp. CA-233914]|uniref:carbohydrate kinase family protein n=1 Tax=Dactylosporangium sp. CA-233914 TaxID=3239934 RepID=UPI003D8CB296